MSRDSGSSNMLGISHSKLSSPSFVIAVTPKHAPSLLSGPRNSHLRHGDGTGGPQVPYSKQCPALIAEAWVMRVVVQQRSGGCTVETLYRDLGSRRVWHRGLRSQNPQVPVEGQGPSLPYQWLRP